MYAWNRSAYTFLNCVDYKNLPFYRTIEYDEFTRRLFEIYTIVKKEGISQVILFYVKTYSSILAFYNGWWIFSLHSAWSKLLLDASISGV